MQHSGYQKLCGKNNKFASDVKCLLALAYLTPEEIPIYYEDLKENICSEAKVIAEWFSENYIWGTYTSPAIYKPHFWSVHESKERNIPRTQNSAVVAQKDTRY